MRELVSDEISCIGGGQPGGTPEGYWDDGQSCRPNEQGLGTVGGLPGPMGVIWRLAELIAKLW